MAVRAGVEVGGDRADVAARWFGVAGSAVVAGVVVVGQTIGTGG